MTADTPTDGRDRRPQDVAERIQRLVDEVAVLPVLDDRSPDEIIGYDEHGVPLDVGTNFSLTDVEVVPLD
jgi:hypothetical protein